MNSSAPMPNLSVERTAHLRGSAAIPARRPDVPFSKQSFTPSFRLPGVL